MEVRYIWSVKFRFTTLLYVLCRYAIMANTIYLLTITHKLNIRVSFLSWRTGALSYIGTVCRTPSFAHGHTWYTLTSCNGGYMISGAISVFGRAAIISKYPVCKMPRHLPDVVTSRLDHKNICCLWPKSLCFNPSCHTRNNMHYPWCRECTVSTSARHWYSDNISVAPCPSFTMYN